jgi:hypothetical protein
MYIAINRFKINQGKKDAFEKMWQRRETHLDNVPGFIKFHLAKGNSEQTHTPIYLTKHLALKRRFYPEDKIRSISLSAQRRRKTQRYISGTPNI